MAITRLNHAVLYVSDLERSVAFYTDVLGFTHLHELTPPGFGGAAFLRAPGSTNDHDLGLFAMGPGTPPSPAGRTTVGLYHLAWEVDTLAELERLSGVLSRAGSLVGASDHGTTKSLYAKDPDGIEFEVAWIVPAALIPAGVHHGIKALDLAREQATFGAQTRGGVGISVPA
jgi:catechol-2,3-dioxygenase